MLPILYSNPYHDKSIPLDREPYEKSESMGMRIRDALLRPLFYHPKKAFVFLALLSLVGIALFTAPWLFLVPVAAAVTMSVVGGLLTLLTGLLVLINTHVFGYADNRRAVEYNECHHEAVYYHGDLVGHVTLENLGNDAANAPKKVPYLTITAENNWKCGFIQGYKLGEQGDQILSKLKRMYGGIRLARFVGYHIPVWGDDALTRRFKQSIPPQLKEEMEGEVVGHNQWAKKMGRPLINFNDLMMLHMLPDLHNIKGLDLTADLLSTGCTAAIARLEDGRVEHLRNTDWASYDEAAGKSLLIERRITGQRVTRSVSFPLLVGTVYGENEDGLTLSINVSPGATVHNPKGVLACLLYRDLLTTCDSVGAVKERLQQDDSQPIGPCQLTASDHSAGSIIRFYQAATPVSELGGKKRAAWDNDPQYSFSHDVSDVSIETPIQIVANDNLVRDKNGVLARGNYHNSAQRIYNVLKGLKSGATPLTSANCVTRAETALRAPLVNNCESVHTIIHVPHKSTFFAAANGFSARFPTYGVDELPGATL